MEGPAVTGGQVLARLDSRELDQVILQARACIQAAEAELDQARSGARPEEIVAARAAVSMAEAQARVAQGAVQQAEGDQATAHADLEAAGAGIEVAVQDLELSPAKADLQAAQAQLALEQARARPAEIAVAEAGVATAQAEETVAQEGVNVAEQAVVAAQATSACPGTRPGSPPRTCPPPRPNRPTPGRTSIGSQPAPHPTIVNGRRSRWSWPRTRSPPRKAARSAVQPRHGPTHAGRLKPL